MLVGVDDGEEDEEEETESLMGLMMGLGLGVMFLLWWFLSLRIVFFLRGSANCVPFLID
jgi:hypothetical protein